MAAAWASRDTQATHHDDVEPHQAGPAVRWRRQVRRELAILGLLVLWCGIVALRATYTKPPSLAWLVGITAGFIASVSIGYMARGVVDQARRDSQNVPKL